MRHTFDNIGLGIGPTDARGPGWKNLERTPAFGPRAKPFRPGSRQGTAHLNLRWNDILPTDKAAGYGRVMPWWILNLTANEAVAFIKAKAKNLRTQEGVLYIFWCRAESTSRLGPDERFHIALAWSPDDEIVGVNCYTPPWGARLDPPVPGSRARWSLVQREHLAQTLAASTFGIMTNSKFRGPNMTPDAMVQFVREQVTVYAPGAGLPDKHLVEVEQLAVDFYNRYLAPAFATVLKTQQLEKRAKR